MNNKFTRTLGMLVMAGSLLSLASSCTKDLDQLPDYSANAEVVYRDPAQIQQVLARLYATFAISGQTGPAGLPDITGIDEGFSNYLRQYWQLQEITTDEAVLGWNDGNLPSVNTLQWNADNEFVRATYDRIYYEIALCNEFIRQTSDAKLSDRGISGAEAGNVRTYRAEARLLRALCYWHAIDLFGGGPFATEEAAIGTYPTYKTRAEIFSYVDTELKALDTEGLLLAPRSVYARADKGVLWTLMTKLYLNAQVYTGTERYTDAITYANKVLQAGYTLSPSYANLFLADNNKTAARNEIILPITFDGTRTKTYGGMTFLVHAAVGRAVTPVSAGINGGWSGTRAKQNLPSLFTSATDTRRNLFFTTAQNPNVDTLTAFSSGTLVTKYRNVTSTGVAGSDTEGNFPDTDFPMFRLPDVQLMYAEAVLRGGAGGSNSQALTYVNAVRARSSATPLTTLTLNDILDERGRELFWEGHRRTDLIRFGKYTTGYNWPFKGGVRAGRDVETTRVLFPLPNTDIVANPNLAGRQNPGY
ncbi:RagB/SusD family nutrient uptake outer membrane protein [Hymenobacter wooponensis]|uniref:RagB/SusD family nutrient uptake outer membrane protein n=1 Tax=Hymenobacter wooponensis TaxID=1525360 RepID=A0A4Z0MRQ6_9BACT|nr:RagB/SusD family nutrient uptake outer membrane protein [Hymenobacter wooponensis]TGD82361.1 RagB/SusD family nutrient uptake outer membrane protein [Hymenobacter wooponensis]